MYCDYLLLNDKISLLSQKFDVISTELNNIADNLTGLLSDDCIKSSVKDASLTHEEKIESDIELFISTLSNIIAFLNSVSQNYQSADSSGSY